MTDKAREIRVNRAPVLTLWAAVAAERLGHDADAAITLGRAVAGSSARVKARAIGLAEQHDSGDTRDAAKQAIRPAAQQTIHLLYYRVSTDKQGQSGFGLNAQRAAVKLHARSVGAEVVAEFRDVESGRKADRAGLAAALATCRAKRATLLIGIGIGIAPVRWTVCGLGDHVLVKLASMSAS